MFYEFVLGRIQSRAGAQADVPAGDQLFLNSNHVPGTVLAPAGISATSQVGAIFISGLQKRKQRLEEVSAETQKPRFSPQFPAACNPDPPGRAGGDGRPAQCR